MFTLTRKLQTIKMLFHTMLIGGVAFRLVKTAVASLPDDWLFFLTSGAIENILCAGVAYISYYVLLELRGYSKKIGLALVFLSTLLALALLKDHRIHVQTTLEQSSGYFTSFVGQSLLFYFTIFFIDRFEQFRRYQVLDKELTDAKEQLLKNQLHPHFLYNAFNSLYSLSLKNDPHTPDYILKLSGMMRYLTDEIHLQYVPLQKELDFIDKYIAIEKIRFGEDARIQFHVEKNGTTQEMVAPFLLITLVENAFKHGFYTNQKNAYVKIDLRTDHKELVFTIENSIFEKQHFQPIHREGKGLENLKRRLTLLYPQRSVLKTTITSTSYIAHLKISLNI